MPDYPFVISEYYNGMVDADDPGWPRCQDTRGCDGAALAPYQRCVAHLTGGDLDLYLATLAPGKILEARGAAISDTLAARLARALAEGSFRTARFDRASFAKGLSLRDADVTPGLSFASAHFDEALDCSGTRFAGVIDLDGVTVTGCANFSKAVFTQDLRVERLSAKCKIDFGKAEFVGAVRISVEAPMVGLTGTSFAAESEIALIGATADLDGARPAKPLTLSGQSGGAVASFRGVDASNLVFADLDLSKCRFAGASHLDKLTLEGNCVFGRPPAGVRRTRYGLPIWRWTRRRSILDEQLWRSGDRGGMRGAGWATGVDRPTAERVAVLYRALRKSQEDAKNEPGAADFYYGEMEARRRAAAGTAEGRLLGVYWLVSGYGLRAWRSFVLLALLMVGSGTVLVGYGLSNGPAGQTGSGVVSAANGTQQITIRLDPPKTTLTGPLARRWTVDRADQALSAELNAVVFRSNDQRLTETGTWTLTTVRILGPLLLGLGLLAMRGRMKR